MDPMGYVQQPYEAKETNDGPNQRQKPYAISTDYNRHSNMFDSPFGHYKRRYQQALKFQQTICFCQRKAEPWIFGKDSSFMLNCQVIHLANLNQQSM